MDTHNTFFVFEAAGPCIGYAAGDGALATAIIAAGEYLTESDDRKFPLVISNEGPNPDVEMLRTGYRLGPLAATVRKIGPSAVEVQLSPDTVQP